MPSVVLNSRHSTTKYSNKSEWEGLIKGKTNTESKNRFEDTLRQVLFDTWIISGTNVSRGGILSVITITLSLTDLVR